MVNASVDTVRRLLYGHYAPFAVVAAITLAGCGRNEVQVYRVAKETQPKALPEPAANVPPGHPDTAGGLPSLTWKLPAGWQEAPAGEMRLASFRVADSKGKQADVSIIPLPGLAGSDLANVNRWRGQVGQPPVNEADLSALRQTVEMGGQPAQLYDQSGPNAGSGDTNRILAAILRKDNVAWFFKMTGDDELVLQQKPNFIDFLKSVTFSASVPALPPSHPPLDATGPVAAGQAAPNPEKPAWQVPAGWQEVPGGQFLVAKYVINGANKAQAAVNISNSAGDGGGVAGNVNRWRRQLGLNELDGAEVDKLATSVDLSSGDKAVIVDLSGTDAKSGQKSRLVGAVVPRAGRTWFYKLMGDEQVVEQTREAFMQFVKTAQYGP